MQAACKHFGTFRPANGGRIEQQLAGQKAPLQRHMAGRIKVSSSGWRQQGIEAI
jgi:hypothetical protein